MLLTEPADRSTYKEGVSCPRRLSACV